MRIRGVRNTLAPLREATDADRAVLRTREAVARQTSYSLTGDPERTAVAFSFAGTTYRLTLPGLGGEGRASPTPTPVV
jgi:hypothetical protein